MFQGSGMQLLVFALLSTGAVVDSSLMLQHRDLQRTAQGITIILLDYSNLLEQSFYACMLCYWYNVMYYTFRCYYY